MNKAKNANGSECGERYALRIVGPNPKTSTAVKITTAHMGSHVKYQSGKDDKAETKNHQSVVVIVTSARFT